MDLTPRPRTRGALRQTLLGVLTLLVGVTGLLVTPLPAKAEDATKVLFLLDVSGSMNQRISSGGTKFAAAQRALKRVADAVPPGTQVGLRVYGSEISQPSGARCPQTSSKSAKPGMLRAAMVRSGPAATRLTRTPSGPSSRAR